MKGRKLPQRGVILWRHRRQPDEAAAEPDGLPELCPVAQCSRCGYEFTAQTVSAVCPRCLEPFIREPCYGGCFSCPLLLRSAGDPAAR